MSFIFILLVLVVVAGILLLVVLSRHKKHTDYEHIGDVATHEITNETSVAQPVVEKHVSKFSYVHSPTSKRDGWLGSLLASNAEKTEVAMNKALSSLGSQYIIFTNLIIDKPGIIKTTEIDHVIISPYGLFCIETKSHAGNIYGGVHSEVWRQYLGGKKYPFYNPLFQNNSHVKALSHLLEAKLNSTIHNYVIFPNAHIVKVKSNDIFSDTRDLIHAITAHQRVVYSRSELETIAYTLARYTSKYADMKDGHIKSVHDYLNSK